MPHPVLSAHIGYLFTEVPLRDRIAAARAAGFGAVEHPSPQSIPAAEMVLLLDGEGMAFSQMAAATGDPCRGEKGIAALPGREAEFRDAFLRALDYAEAVGCRLLHPMAGVVDGRASVAAAAATWTANLAYAVDECRKRPVSVLIEALSHAAVPGYFLSSLEEAAALAEAVDRSAIKLLVDTFHAAAGGTDPGAFVASHVGRIGHVHVADHPGRHEPGTGALDFEAFLGLLTSCGYGRAVGFEYIPSRPTAETLAWMPAWKERLRSRAGPAGASPAGKRSAT
jgi:hydroxypyruvate isomerase